MKKKNSLVRQYVWSIILIVGGALLAYSMFGTFFHSFLGMLIGGVIFLGLFMV